MERIFVGAGRDMSRYSMKDKVSRAQGYMMLVAIKTGKQWFTPAEIGKAVCMSEATEDDGPEICKELLGQGLVVANENGEYRRKSD